MLQEAAGIDIVTDGEQSRQHFVHGFLTRIDGIDFTKRVTIGIRADRYKAEVPTVTGPLRRREPVHLDEVRWARAHTDRRLKFTLPGPMTIVDTLADEYFRDRRALAMEFARVLNEEIRDLEKAGLDVVQLPEDVADTIRAAMKYVPPDRLFPCTNCGMVPLPREVARRKLLALGAGARLVRRELEAGA